jgi:hypothetical protein
MIIRGHTGSWATGLLQELDLPRAFSSVAGSKFQVAGFMI